MHSLSFQSGMILQQRNSMQAEGSLSYLNLASYAKAALKLQLLLDKEKMGYQPNVLPPKKNNLTWLWIVLGVGCGCGFFVFVVGAAVLFPVLSQAREKARQVGCLTHVRELGLSMLMYSQDYDENFPKADHWSEKIFSYYKNDSSTKCPSVSNDKNGQYGIAYNDKVAGMNLSKIKNPAQGILLYDSSNLKKDAHDAVTSLPVPGRHSKGNNQCFQDGHAKSVLTADKAGVQ